MKFILLPFIVAIIMLPAGKAGAQDTLNLMDGQRIAANKIIADTSSTLLRYEIKIKRNGALKQRFIDKLEIYSIDYADHSHQTFYRQDSAMGFPFSLQEMDRYISGEREARKCYKAPWVTAGGVLIGGLAADYIGFWSLTTTVVYGTGMALLGPKVKTSENISSALKSDPHFVKGYKDIATRKKVKNAILGTALGIVVVGVSSIIINKGFIGL